MWRLWHFAVRLIRLIFWGNTIPARASKWITEFLLIASALGYGDFARELEPLTLWWGWRMVFAWSILQVIGGMAAVGGVLFTSGKAWEQSTGVRLRFSDVIERDHLRIFRLRIFNDGKAAIPEVTLTRVLREDGSDAYQASLPKELQWSDRPNGQPLLLSVDMTHGRTVDAGGVAYHPGFAPVLCITAMNGAQLQIDLDVLAKNRRKVWLQFTARASGCRVTKWFGFEPQRHDDGRLVDYTLTNIPPPLPRRSFLLHRSRPLELQGDPLVHGLDHWIDVVD